MACSKELKVSHNTTLHPKLQRVFHKTYVSSGENHLSWFYSNCKGSQDHILSRFISWQDSNRNAAIQINSFATRFERLHISALPQSNDDHMCPSVAKGHIERVRRSGPRTWNEKVFEMIVKSKTFKLNEIWRTFGLLEDELECELPDNFFCFHHFH